ncbi:hypothetical protein B0H14DRAFT_3172919 [Mycena olivaceomarginata]|nr:hypothetical protein B0H14DRAFT_3172919 [Mycena olivaceomarginata]
MLLQAPSGVGPSARMRSWTYLLELRMRGDLAAPMRARAEAETCHRYDTVH